MAKEISQQLAQRVEEVARYLLPNGKRSGNQWLVGSIHGESGESLKVCLKGEKAGIWSDFAEGSKGDLLDLWALTHNSTLSNAIKEVTRYLGIPSQQKFEGHKNSSFAKPKLNNIGELALSSSVMSYLVNERKLTAQTLRTYQIGERNGDIIFPYRRSGELILVKYLKLLRVNNKKKISVEPNCEPCLFGWNQIPTNARKVIICEGEIDAMSLYQYGLPALSVPFGGGGGDKQRWIEYEFDRLAIFDQIYLCLDNDDEGHKAKVELIDRLGRHRCHIVTLPYKDANECLQSNVSREVIHQCFDEAKTLDPEELKSAREFVNQVIGEFYPSPDVHIGYDAPWEKTNDIILFRPGELSVWTGINGHGKSQFLGQVILHMMKQGARVCIASLEMKPKRLLMRLTRQASALAEPSIEYIHAIHEWLGDKLWLFDLVGTAKVKRLLEVFQYARQRYGVDVFVIDSLMKLDIFEDDYKMQKALIEQLCDFKNQHNCHIHLVIHPRKTEDESKAPGKLDIKGTGAITDLADNCFSIWRNKKKEKLIQKHLTGSKLDYDEQKIVKASDCKWICNKQRNGDWEGTIGFWFDPASLQYLSQPDCKPSRIVEYSKIITSSI
ncbi:bifunctional DNA primase/helicase [Legionella genomosp. 1]|uniref:bifunctional DNA primase/helicase n=1 Tax=Legionella genomosp. 1 TaxID=1093625 RepID=UPI0021CB98D6|nr:toprim domain-containing protein [Legionella genomosp. 1]